MRRIYESDAVARDDDEPFQPGERRPDYDPQSFRSITSATWADRLLPNRVGRWAITVALSVPDRTFTQGDAVPFEVTMRNRLPVPVSITTRTPVRWTWSVDGHTEAARIPLYDPPDESRSLDFERGETKEFRRSWSGRFQVTKREWEPAGPGSYDLTVAINTANAASAGLSAERTVTIE